VTAAPHSRQLERPPGAVREHQHEPDRWPDREPEREPDREHAREPNCDSAAAIAAQKAERVCGSWYIRFPVPDERRELG
jgi:hypothetical protein